VAVSSGGGERRQGGVEREKVRRVWSAKGRGDIEVLDIEYEDSSTMVIKVWDLVCTIPKVVVCDEPLVVKALIS
jgi:hypothetical protein